MKISSSRKSGVLHSISWVLLASLIVQHLFTVPLQVRGADEIPPKGIEESGTTSNDSIRQTTNEEAGSEEKPNPENTPDNTENKEGQPEEPKSLEDEQEPEAEGPHEHEFSEFWSFDDKEHWREAICDHDVVTDQEKHQRSDWIIDDAYEYKEGWPPIEFEKHMECTVCGKVMDVWDWRMGFEVGLGGEEGDTGSTTEDIVDNDGRINWEGLEKFESDNEDVHTIVDYAPVRSKWEQFWINFLILSKKYWYHWHIIALIIAAIIWLTQRKSLVVVKANGEAVYKADIIKKQAWLVVIPSSKIKADVEEITLILPGKVCKKHKGELLNITFKSGLDHDDRVITRSIPEDTNEITIGIKE